MKPKVKRKQAAEPTHRHLGPGYMEWVGGGEGERKIGMSHAQNHYLLIVKTTTIGIRKKATYAVIEDLEISN